MIVSSQSLLNILIPSDNKTLKEVLKEADNKSLQQNKTAGNLQDILKNLVNNVKSQEKSNETVANILKNASVFKNMGNFTQQLNTLINTLPKEEKFSNLKAILQSLQTNIKDMDDKTLKDNILKSGIFLESKLSKGESHPNLNKLNTLLLQIKEVIKNDPSPKAQQLKQLIDTITNNPIKNAAQLPALKENLNQALNLLKSLSQNQTNGTQTKIAQLTQQLENLTQNSKLLEAKIELQSGQNTPSSIKESNITALKQNESVSLKTSVDSAIKTNNPTVSSQNIAQPKETNQTIQQQNISLLQESKSLLVQLKSELLHTKNSLFIPLLKNIDTLIKHTEELLKNALLQKPNTIHIPATQINTLEPQKILQSLPLLEQTKHAIVQNPKIEQSIQSLLNKTNEMEQLKQSVISDKMVLPKHIQELTQSIKENLTLLQTQLSSLKNTDTSLLNQLVDKMIQHNSLFSKMELPPVLKEFLSLQNPALFAKENNSFSAHLNGLLTQIKTALLQNNTNAQAQPFQMLQSIEKLETVIQNHITQLQQNAPKESSINNNMFNNDVKATLLQLKEELGQNSQFKEQLKGVERLLTHVDYYQLLSATSNSNFVYLPFIWDMLDEGQLSMKKTDDEKYFCEIHLTLKEFGNMDMYLSLYDKNSLDLTIFSNRDFVKEMIRDHLPNLKKGLNSIQLIPRNIKVLDLKEDDEPQEKSVQSTYTQHNEELSFGVNIKV
jgi:hypothetical protein